MRRLEIFATTVEVPLPDPTPPLPNPDPIVTVPVVWQVISPQRLPESDSWVLYALTPDQYENLSYNMAELLRWVTEAQWRLIYYTQSIIGEQDADGEENNNGNTDSQVD